jgi:uroporphyrinogen decarboxylase
MDLNPNFERIVTTFKNQEPDRVPLGDFWADKEAKEAFLGKPVDDLTTEIEFWYRAGFDFVPLPSGLIAPAQSLGKVSKVREDGKEGSVREWADESDGLIKNETDFEHYDWPSPNAYSIEKYEKAAKLLPTGMKLCLIVGKIYTPAWMLMGAENFYIAIRKRSPLVEKLIQRIGELQCAIYEKILENVDIGGVFSSDDIAHNGGLFVPLEFLKKNIFPWYKRIGDICRDKGIFYVCHSDGKMTDVLDDLIELGFNGIHPIQPNVMDIRQIKERFGKKLCLLGNLDLEFPLATGTENDVKKEVKRLIRDLAPGGGYMLSSSNSITNFIPVNNFKAMIEGVFEYGKYPVST